MKKQYEYERPHNSRYYRSSNWMYDWDGGDISIKEQEKKEWKPVAIFGGNGIIYAYKEERKIVTEGLSDFHYNVESIKPKEELCQKN